MPGITNGWAGRHAGIRRILGAEGRPHLRHLSTEEPHGALADLHDRMPVMLSPEMAEQWLAEGTKMNPSRSGICFEVEFYPVSKAVNSVRNEGPDLIEQIALAS